MTLGIQANAIPCPSVHERKSKWFHAIWEFQQTFGIMARLPKTDFRMGHGRSAFDQSHDRVSSEKPRIWAIPPADLCPPAPRAIGHLAKPVPIQNPKPPEPKTGATTEQTNWCGCTCKVSAHVLFLVCSMEVPWHEMPLKVWI